MPLNVRKFGASLFLVLFFAFGIFAQAPTSADVMRDRITKVKTMVAVKNYTAAIYELEGIRRETNEPAVNNVVQVMLMSCYLEQCDYKRVQTLLTETFNAQKTNKPNADYFSVAGQVVKGARAQLDRYKSLGLSISDRNLPIDAVADINKMREMVETVVDQSKTLGNLSSKNSPTAMALLEEATNARTSLARDDYDAKRWKEEVADARESLMASRSVINAVDDSAMQTNAASARSAVVPNSNPGVVQSNETTASIIPVSNTDTQVNPEPIKTETAKATETFAQTENIEKIKTPEKETVPETTKQTAQTPNTNAGNVTPNVKSPSRSRLVQKTVLSTPVNSNAPRPETAADAPNSNSPLAIGSLIEYATEKVNPTYPPAAKTMRMTGVVRVEVLVNEDGQVSVENTIGPKMLQSAALDAVKRWKFKPFLRDGQPVKAKGFVNFNFNL